MISSPRFLKTNNINSEPMTRYKIITPAIIIKRILPTDRELEELDSVSVSIVGQA